MTEIVARQANAGIGEHYGQEEKHVPASSIPVAPNSSTLPNEPSHSILSPTAATSAIQPNTVSHALPASGELEGIASITSTPDGAETFVDSVGHGHAPALLKLPPGLHKVQLAMHGYRDWVSEIEVKAGSIVNVTCKLEK